MDPFSYAKRPANTSLRRREENNTRTQCHIRRFTVQKDIDNIFLSGLR